MFPFSAIHLDRLSFLLGFITASLFWWIVLRIRPLLPQFRATLNHFYQSVNLRNLVSAEEQLRHETTQRAQRYHLAARLFSLDEILVPPAFLAPPDYQTPGEINNSLTMAGQTLPYLPDWPELTSTLGVPLLTPMQAISHGSHIVIIGQPGSGKSTALAYIASQIARKEHPLEEYQNAIPFFLHVLDLNLNPITIKDPLQTLSKAITAQVNAIYQPQVNRFLQTITKNQDRKMILFLDGIDELPPDEANDTALYLFNLLQKLPKLQIVTTGSSEYLDGLLKMGFYPLGLASWNMEQCQSFVQRWGQLWAQYLLPEIKGHYPSVEINPLLINNWLIGERAYETPLEWTIKTWAAYAGDLVGTGLLQLIETHINRFIPSVQLAPALDELAHHIVQRKTYWMDIDDMEKILSAYIPPDATGLPDLSGAGNIHSGATSTGSPLPEGSPVDVSTRSEESSPASPEGTEETAALTLPTRKQQKNREGIVSQGERILSALLSCGILVQHSNHRVRFSNPLFLGYLSSMQASAMEIDGFVEKLDWTVSAQILRCVASCTPSATWITHLIQENNPPLFRNWFIAARWLPDTPSNSDLRSYILSNFVHMIQDENLSLAIRSRLAAAFVVARDPAALKMFKALLNSPSTYVRQIGAMGCGAMGNQSIMNELLSLLADAYADVRVTACLAISGLPGEATLSTLGEILAQGDEELRQTCAESLALKAEAGKKILEEALTSNDLLVRRAAVLGIFQIRDEWTRKQLEKIAVEDGQWVVRNAAAQGLEDLQKTISPALLPLPIASDCPWLLAFAGKLGLGIRPGEPAIDILLNALKSGSSEEQMAALVFLRKEADDGVLGALYSILYGDRSDLREAVYLALWWISLTGYKLPSPIKFGLG